jgi:hypothetical protein
MTDARDIFNQDHGKQALQLFILRVYLAYSARYYEAY